MIGKRITSSTPSVKIIKTNNQITNQNNSINSFNNINSDNFLFKNTHSNN